MTWPPRKGRRVMLKNTTRLKSFSCSRSSANFPQALINVTYESLKKKIAQTMENISRNLPNICTFSFVRHSKYILVPRATRFHAPLRVALVAAKNSNFSLANETQCALGIKLQSTAHFRRVINCNVVVFKNQRVYKRTCFSFELFERR